MSTSYAGGPAATANAQLVARLERLPVTRRLLLIRIIIGSATFFDAYTVLVIAFAMPSLVEEWSLTPEAEQEIADAIKSAGLAS